MHQKILLDSVYSLIRYVNNHVPGGPDDLRKLERGTAVQRLKEIRILTLDVALALVTKPPNASASDDDLSKMLGFRPRDIATPNGTNYLHFSKAHDGVIAAESNGNVLDLRCPPGFEIQIRESSEEHLLSVWLEAKQLALDSKGETVKDENLYEHHDEYCEARDVASCGCAERAKQEATT